MCTRVMHRGAYLSPQGIGLTKLKAFWAQKKFWTAILMRHLYCKPLAILWLQQKGVSAWKRWLKENISLTEVCFVLISLWIHATANQRGYYWQSYGLSNTIHKTAVFEMWTKTCYVQLLSNKTVSIIFPTEQF